MRAVYAHAPVSCAHSPGVDQVGNDLRVDAALTMCTCAALCDAESRCVAWSFVESASEVLVFMFWF
jgi:hypothetical protein